MSNSLRQENAPSGVNKDQGGQSTLGTQSVPWKDIHTVDLNVQRDVTIQGNLSVTGNTSTVEVQELHTEEPMIRVAKINTSDAVDIGVYGATNTESDGSGGVNTLYHGFIRDASDGVWKLFEGNSSSESNGTIALDSNTEGTVSAKLNLPAAGDLKIATVPVVSTAAELNKLNAVADGIVSASKALVVDSSKDLAGLNDLSLTGSITATTVNANLVGDVTGNSDTASALETSRTITLDGDVTGQISFDGSQDVTITTSLDDGGLITVGDGSSSEELQVGDSIVIKGTANETEVAYSTSTNEFVVGLPSTISGLTSVSSTGFTGDLTGKADTADALHTARTLSISGDVAGSVSFDGSANADIVATIQSGSVENSMLVNSGLSVSVDGGAVDVINLGEDLKFASGTDIDVTYNSATNEVAIALESEIASDTTGNAATASALQTARTLSLSGDLSGSVSFDGSANADIDATIQASSVENSMLVNSGITIQDDNASVESIALGGSLRFSQTPNQTTVNFDTSTDTITFGLESTIDSDITGNAATASALETSRTLSISGDVAGSVSFDGSANADIVATIQSGSVENSMLANSSISFTDGTATDVTSLGETIKIEGTANEIEVALDTGTSTFTVGLPSNITADVTGNASTATALETSRTFAIEAGPVQATGISFDGTGNVSLTSTIADDQITNAMLENDKLVIDVDSVEYDRPLGSTLGFSATNLDLSYSASTNTVEYGLPSIIGSSTTGNSATATALETARTLSVSGDASGSVSFDGTSNADIALTVDSVDLSSLEIASETQEVSALVDADLFIVKDADGSNSKMPASVIKSYVRDEVVTAGIGVDISSSGVVSIGQEVETDSDVTFNQVTLGTATIDETDALKLDDITGGIGSADKALVLNSASSITSGLNSLQAVTLTDGTASISAGVASGLTSLSSGNITISGDEVFSSNHLVLNAGTNQVQIASGDKIVLQGDAGGIDISGDANFSRSVFYAVPSVKNSSYSVASGDHILMFDLSSAGSNQTITLGNSGQNINTNRVLVIKNIGTANNLVFASASQIDNSSASSTILAPGEKITIIGTSSNGWQSI
jgi:hypothetical protein